MTITQKAIDAIAEGLAQELWEATTSRSWQDCYMQGIYTAGVKVLLDKGHIDIVFGAAKSRWQELVGETND